MRMMSSSAVVDTAKAEAPKTSPIYVAATRQHVGKTSTSLALLSGLQKRFEKVGFMKPVGQQSLIVKAEDGQSVTVDKDATLVKEHFRLDHLNYGDMSPILIPPGYTRDYLGKFTRYDNMGSFMFLLHSMISPGNFWYL
jgi:hypothetical protein